MAANRLTVVALASHRPGLRRMRSGAGARAAGAAWGDGEDGEDGDGGAGAADGRARQMPAAATGFTTAQHRNEAS